MQHPTSNELITIESVLQMGGGYVLNFTNARFEAFMREYGVDIYSDAYGAEGNSKAKRLRCFLRRGRPPRTGRVLAALLARRKLQDTGGLTDDEVARYRAIALRLGASNADVPGQATTDSDLLQLGYRPEMFRRLPVEEAQKVLLLERMEEARRCIDVKAYLSAVILCGSVLEGMCLGFGSSNPERVNRAFQAQYNRTPKKLPEWRLGEWIEVLGRLGVFSPNVVKFLPFPGSRS